MRVCRVMVFFSVIVLVLFHATTLQAQYAADSPANEIIDTEVFLPSPTRAAMLSATLPGLGQLYNRKYWKVPIIYAGFGTLIYFVDLNSKQYNGWRKAWLARVDGNPNTIDDYPLHSTDVLERAMNYYRRNLEITYMLAAALYLLNILDASVDAHLMNFDVGESLSMGLQPVTVPHPAGQFAYRQSAQFRVTIKF